MLWKGSEVCLPVVVLREYLHLQCASQAPSSGATDVPRLSFDRACTMEMHDSIIHWSAASAMYGCDCCG
jgi:hypothetical protein